MLSFLRARPDAAIVEALHEAVVAAARRQSLFATLGVPDSPWGRIESVMLHALLIVRRLNRLAPPAPSFSQPLVDGMFTGFELGLRQIGVGDLSVPKKMKALGGDWLGRIEAYAGPLDRCDESALAAALARNVLSRPDEPEAARPLAAHILACEAALAATPWEAMREGRLVWPPIGPTLRR